MRERKVNVCFLYHELVQDLPFRKPCRKVPANGQRDGIERSVE
jgi:hypothetical protein